MATKTASDMSLAELEKALTGAREKLSGMEKELADYRKSVQSYVLEFGKRQRQFERAFGMVSEAPAARGSVIGNAKRGRKGKLSASITDALKSAKSPMSADDIVSATRWKSKPSVSQTLMKMVAAGTIHRYGKDGKVMAAKAKGRAKAYALA